MKAGSLGPLDTNKIILRGWSGGAQMVSWMYQVQAQNHTFPQINIIGGVMLSGGTYNCYNDPQPGRSGQTGSSNVPVGSCVGCTEGGPSHCQDDPLCTTCDPTVKTYCQQCCPRNYTEAYYYAKPEEYSKHPPTFLAQMSTVDNHADLCACKNYYETLKAHGVKAELVLVPKEDESCFCVGNPKNPDTAGSPFAGRCNDPTWGKDCTTMGGKDCCIAHTMGFASMLDPALKFVQDILATAAAA